MKKTTLIPKLKYLGYATVFQEVPNEISLAINISGCPHHCEGCHSKYLWEYKGNYISNDIDKLIDQYDNLISCVCFMGGDQNINELAELLKQVKNRNLKTCIYSGRDDKEYFDNILPLIDYLKIGRYIEKLGGLNSKTTNQRMYDITNEKEITFYK
jgi:anaerobic ribonucleoside-triphosphate reductase activating protein